MNFILQPWQLLVVALASWVHHEQQEIIRFYQAEIKALMEAQGKKRLLLSDDHRRLLPNENPTTLLVETTGSKS